MSLLPSVVDCEEEEENPIESVEREMQPGESVLGALNNVNVRNVFAWLSNSLDMQMQVVFSIWRYQLIPFYIQVFYKSHGKITMLDDCEGAMIRYLHCLDPVCHRHCLFRVERGK